jgi:selenocysteine lyase/cysteine desulfurase
MVLRLQWAQNARTTGIGVLYARKHFRNMAPFQGGGEMIKSLLHHGKKHCT